MTGLLPAELRGLRHYYGRSAVLRGLDLRLEAGELCALVGANGSGKTTIFSILVGLLAPSEGVRSYGGRPQPRLDPETRARLAHLDHRPQLYPLLTAGENLALDAELRQAYRPYARPIRDCLERFGIDHAIDRRVGEMSRGMQQRVALARALAPEPELVVLDEPFTALDDEGRAQLAGELRREAERGAAVIFSSHDSARVAELATRVLRLRGGRWGAELSRAPEESASDFEVRIRASASGREGEA